MRGWAKERSDVPTNEVRDAAGFYGGHAALSPPYEVFPDGEYCDVPGLCKVATIDEIEAQGWSLNPGRYVGVAAREEDDFDFFERLEEFNEELEVLNSEARELEARIAENVAMIIETQ